MNNQLLLIIIIILVLFVINNSSSNMPIQSEQRLEQRLQTVPVVQSIPTQSPGWQNLLLNAPTGPGALPILAPPQIQQPPILAPPILAPPQIQQPPIQNALPYLNNPTYG